MATLEELQIRLRLTGASTTRRQLNSLERTFGRLQRSISAFAAVAVFRVLTQQIGKLAKFAGDLDRSLSDVERTTGLTSDQVEKLGSDLGDLSTVMAGSIEDFFNLAVTAGRAGVKTQEEIKSIAVTAGQFGKISRITFDQAARDLIRLSRAFGAADVSENINEISDSIILAGKRFAVTETEIIEATQRTTAAIGALNLSIPETIVLMGAITERIGKARKAGTEFNSAIFKAATRLDEFSKITGKSASELERIIDKDAMAGVVLLLQGLRDAASTSTERMSLLKKVVGEVGAKAIAPLIPQLDQLFKTMNDVSEAVSMGGATAKDYSIVSAQFDVKIDENGSAHITETRR